MGSGIEDVGDACASARIERIAHSLSLECRWSGQMPSMYSVASHSVYVSLRCEELALVGGHSVGAAKSVALHGLMHDAAEAYTGDLITPIKDSALLQVSNRILTWREWEDTLLLQIYMALAIPASEGWEDLIVHKADKEILLDEIQRLDIGQVKYEEIASAGSKYEGVSPAGYAVMCASAEDAEADFLARWDELR
jgi:hypothetical protein